MKRIVVPSLAVLLWLAWTGSAAMLAAAEKKPAKKNPAGKQTTELTQADNGKTVNLAVGKSVVIRLPGNPTTGYSWRTAKVTGQSVAAVGEPKYQADAHAPGIVGVGGTYTFTFKAAKQGKAEVNLEYVRPWEKGIAPIKTFSATVEVTTQ
jgi:inhibitor of cysteine peptidase